MAMCGCEVKPFGLSTWVIVMPGGKMNVTVGSMTHESPTPDDAGKAPGAPTGQGDEAGELPPPELEQIDGTL